MSTLLQTHSGAAFYTNESVEDVHNAVERGIVQDVWWFAPWGQRFSERLWIAAEEVAYIRSESDDG